MKHKLLAFLIFTLFYFSASSQTYVPFPSGIASWKVIRCFYFYPPDGYDVLTFDQSGDTTIGSVNYHKVYQTFHHLPGSIYDTTYTVFLGGIREDQKKLYIVSEYLTGDNQERIMYDFNADEAGDTVLTNLLNYGDPIKVLSIVSAIDSVLIDGTYHRQLKFNTIDGYPTLENWIEGIGSNFGLIFASFYLVTDNSYDLRCFSTENVTYQNNQLLLGYCQTTPPVNCDFSTGITELSQPSHFTAFPNPAREWLRVHLNVPFAGENRIVIYSALGQSVLSQELSFNTDYSINLSSLAPGPYWVQLISDYGLRETVTILVN